MRDSFKRGAIIGLAALVMGTTTGCSLTEIDGTPDAAIVENISEQTPYQRLKAVRRIKLSTYKNTYVDDDGIRREYSFVDEEDVLDLSRQMVVAVEEYLHSCGAGNWANDEQFWPDDMEYVLTAMAYRESTYRTNFVNKEGYGGITAFDDVDSLRTLREEWFVKHVWNDKIPNVDCSSENFDMFDPNQCMELTLHYLGYTMATRFKEGKYFNFAGERRCVWDKIKYDKEMQLRLNLASYRYGVNNVTYSVFGLPNNQGKVVPLKDYVYSGYVEDVLAKKQELINNYKHDLSR